MAGGDPTGADVLPLAPPQRPSTNTSGGGSNNATHAVDEKGLPSNPITRVVPGGSKKRSGEGTDSSSSNRRNADTAPASGSGEAQVGYSICRLVWCQCYGEKHLRYEPSVTDLHTKEYSSCNRTMSVVFCCVLLCSVVVRHCGYDASCDDEWGDVIYACE